MSRRNELTAEVHVCLKKGIHTKPLKTKKQTNYFLLPQSNSSSNRSDSFCEAVLLYSTSSLTKSTQI